MGFDADFDEMIALKVHDITPEYIAQVALGHRR